jgi:hypothetical protein
MVRLAPVHSLRMHAPATIDALAEALVAEARLLSELTDVVRRQRDAIARDDIEALDDTVFATHRVLLTLGQARKQRRAINHLLGESDDLSLSALDDVFGGAPPARIRDGVAQLSETARVLHREVDMNRRVLRQAIDTGDQLVRALIGAPDAPASYEPGTAPTSGGVILDRRI